jgi:putative ABC transport system permease protein
MSVIRALVVRPIVREKMRTTLTLLGIAVGVAVVVAIQLANQSALRAFRESIDAVAGRANWQIEGDAGPLDENLLLRLQPLWRDGVRFAPVIDVEGVIEPSQEPIRLLGVDLLSDIHFRDYRYAKVVSGARHLDLFRDDSVIVPATFAREQHLSLGSPLTLSILGRVKTMTVRGILEPKGPATAFNGSIAIVDIAAAQSSFGMTGKVTRVDLIIPERSADVSVRTLSHADETSALLSRIARLLPPATRIERPSRRNERVDKMLRAFRVNLFALAAVALLVGMFLVYNTVLISILRRRKDVGVLKTIGAAPRQIFAAFLAEGLLFGAVGSFLGIVLGDTLAFSILRQIGRIINSLYVTSQPEAIALTPGVIASGIAVGTILSLVSALQPSLEAAAVRPNALIRPGLQQTIGVPRTRRLAIAAMACFLAAALASRVPPWNGIAAGGYVSVLFVVAGFSLLAPMLVRAASRLSSAPLQRVWGVIGRLASASLPASLRRTSVASAALSLATGMMVAVALMVGSFRETVRVWVDQTISSDLWLRPARGLTNASSAVFSPQIYDDLKRFPFIAAIDRVRGRDIIFGDTIISVGSGDFGVAMRYGDLPMTGRMREGGVVVSESFSLKFHRGIGDVITIPTAHGLHAFRIDGVYRDYSNDRGVVVMDRPLYVRWFDDDAINTVVIYLRKGVNAEWARAQLERGVGKKYHAFAITNRETRAEVMKIFDQTFLITYALLAVAIVVAVLGIVNTLAALILERSRELALLRVLGMSRAEVGRMIVLESTLLGVTSTVVGLMMGYVLSWILIYVINKQSFGWTIEFHTPARLIAASLAVTLLASMVAGLMPARLANRINVAAALESE